MSFMESISHYLKNNKLSRKLSMKSKRRSKDLIRISSREASLSRAKSNASTSSVHLPTHSSMLPAESPTRRKRLTPADLNLQPMLDNAEALEPAMSRSSRGFSMPEYPVYKLDTTTPALKSPKKLQDPIKLGNGTCEKQMIWRAERFGGTSMASCGSTSKLKRSVTGLFKTRSSSKVPGSSSLSMKKFCSPTTPHWVEKSKLGDEDFLVDEKAEIKWLEAKSLSGRYLDYEIWGGA
ncbi:hypothetical protein N7495_000976 [Penicillium taxi]|uniref:uncharacterized protein n=1 Tax=Penicillium taxi TaxID=168475 RepID=UPI0025452A71|nr:uncharacterized protein N7495_000976 [Penicillium taxi]KAJ5908294.1 hypothetical protein N7495_000976 [Penicillium taxi]